MTIYGLGLGTTYRLGCRDCSFIVQICTRPANTKSCCLSTCKYPDRMTPVLVFKRFKRSVSTSKLWISPGRLDRWTEQESDDSPSAEPRKDPDASRYPAFQPDDPSSSPLRHTSTALQIFVTAAFIMVIFDFIG